MERPDIGPVLPGKLPVAGGKQVRKLVLPFGMEDERDGEGGL